MIKRMLLLAIVWGCCLDLSAQKKPLDIEAYKLWRRIDATKLSDDGRWVMYHYTFITREGHENDVPVTHLYDSKTGRDYELRNVSDAYFFNNGKGLRYVVPKSSNDTSALAKDSVILLSLRNMKRTLWERPYDFTESSSSPLIRYTYPLGDKKDGRSFKRLVLWNFETGDSTVFDSVGNYSLYDDNRKIIYVKEHGTHRSLIAGAINGKKRVIYSDRKVLFDRYSLKQGERGVFSAASDSSFMTDPDLLFSFSAEDGTCKLVLDKKEIKLPDDNYRVLDFSYNVFGKGKYVYLDVAPVKRVAKTKNVEPDKSFELELWKWDDEEVPLRQSRWRDSRKDLPKYVYHVDTRKCVLVAPAGSGELSMPVADDYSHVLLIDEAPYKLESDWKDGEISDITLASLETGERRLLFKAFRGSPVWSPNGRYVLFYHEEQQIWYKLDPKTGEMTDISSAIGYPVYNEAHDIPRPANSYGIAGWSQDGNTVYLNDRFDIWTVDLTGKKPLSCLTKGFGRKNNIVLRRSNPNYDNKTIDTSKPILLDAVEVATMNAGIYRLTPSGKVQKVVMGPYAIDLKHVTDDGKYCVFTRQSVSEFRDIWWSKIDFAKPQKITDANPQQENYLWGTVRLVEWTNYDGKQNRGLLYLPENYDPAKRYPMIVNFYETHTGGLHSYPTPTLSSAMIDPITYVSNGYVVFMPDIHFTIGVPGESCYNAVVSGTHMLIEKGIADSARIGLCGHSWSGYQVAYLVTRTNMFRCANPGAAVSSMVSAYTGIRAGSGLPRMFMYEETQSRMGVPLWGAGNTEKYIKQSPIFYADKIHTPLLIFHCDADEAVPYAEGLNLFLAMRRLGRPAWLLNYKGDQHFLSNHAAEVDWTIRLQQFFDYYLKDAPMPRWMKEGIHITERGIDQKYDYVK